MENENLTEDFMQKFSQLTGANQRYIIGIQQALVFAQATETAVGEYSDKENGEAHETRTV